ncbi:(R)-specific enoyl-CoA hydratase-like [Salvia splendens]|nr:(R)-specific enoyl-CoA hydratase-like [Salvia splendens]
MTALHLFDKNPKRIPKTVIAMRRLLLNSVSSLKHYSSSASASNVLKPGDILKQSRIFSIAEVEDYSKLTHDHNPLHFDLECATKAGYKDTPIPGLLVASLFPRIIASHFPGAIYVKQTLEFREPVFVGDDVVGEVQANSIRQLKDKFMVKFATTCRKDGGEVVIGGEATAILPALAVNGVGQG